MTLSQSLPVQPFNIQAVAQTGSFSLSCQETQCLPHLSCKHVSSQSWIANSQFRFIKTDGNLLLVRKGERTRDPFSPYPVFLSVCAGCGRWHTHVPCSEED